MIFGFVFAEFFLKLILLLQKAGIEPAVFNEVEPDPTTDLVRRVMEVWQEEETC